MIEYDLSLEILNEVFDNKATFANALKDKFFKNPAIRPHRNVVAGLAGCEIRHHLLFQYLLKDVEGLEEADLRCVYLALANDYYFHRFPQEEFDEELLKRIGEEKFALVKPVLDRSSNPEEYVPTEVKRTSQLYLSLRYNIPDWTLRIFRHYPRFPILKTLKKFGRPAANQVRVKADVSPADLISTGEFEATKTDHILNYIGKTALRKNDFFKEGKIFSEKELTKIIVDSYPINEPCELLLYHGEKDSSFERELIETYGSRVGLNLATPNVDDKVEVTRAIKEKGLHNVNFFSAPDPSSMDAAISRSQELVIAVPESTCFDLVPTAPDYLLNFPKERMDEIFAKEKEVLEGCSKYVEVGGKLLYLIYTISMKEGNQTVAAFLQNHPEFELIEQHQYYPYEGHQTAAYLAVMVKKENELSIAPPLNELSSLGVNPTNVASAANK